MGNEHSSGSWNVPVVPEEPPIKAEKDLEETPAGKASSSKDYEMVKARADEESASQTNPHPEEVTSFSEPAEAVGTGEPQETSLEGGQPMSLSQSASSDKGQPTGQQACELATATPTVERSSGKAAYIAPRIPPDAAKPGAETGVSLLTSNCLAESTGQKKPGDISSRSRTEKEQDSEKQTTIQGACDYGSFEMLAEVQPEQVASGMTAHSSMMTALVTQPLETQSSVAAEIRAAEMTQLPTAEAQNEGCSEIDAQTAEGSEDQSASGIPQEASCGSTLAQRTLDTPEKPPTSKIAGTDFIEAIQSDKGSVTTQATVLVEEHTSTVTMQVPETEPFPDYLDECSSMALKELDSVIESSLMEDMDEACLDTAAAETAEAPAITSEECLQPLHFHWTNVNLTPAAQETADGEAEIQGSARNEKDAPKEPGNGRKQEAKFSKTFCLCCRCNAGEGEGNSEQ